MPFIILDRDGVINFDSDEYIKSPDEWQPIQGSLEAIAQLNRSGYRVLIATNQSGVARGLYDLETLDQIHEKLMRELSAVGGYVEEIFFCPHHPNENCNCRKPKPGLFYQMTEKYNFELAGTYFIGDSLTDVEVARVVGCIPLLVLTGKIKEELTEHPTLQNVHAFSDLAQAVSYVLSTRNNHE